MQSVVKKANPEGQVYALIGLQIIKSGSFKPLFEDFKKNLSDKGIGEISSEDGGCDSERVILKKDEVIKKLDFGEYAKRFTEKFGDVNSQSEIFFTKLNNNSESNDTSRKIVSGKEGTGTFRLKFKNEGLDGTNEIKIDALGNNKLKVEFDLIYPFQSGGANIGKAQGEANIEGDTAIYSTKDSDGSCEIKIKFVKPGLIQVTQQQEGSGCGFGLNVSAQGSYKKVSDKKPTFSEEN